MRNISATKITSSLGRSSFLPFIDDKIAFSNYTDRLVKGKLSRRPAIYGSNSNEGAFMVGPNNPAAAQQITYSFACPVPYLTPLRERLNLTTYRYQYSGNFSNVSPVPGLGAYHTSELPLFFGTSGLYVGADSPFETAASEKMQDLYLSFAKDPHHGPEKEGWLKSTSGQFIELAKDNVTARMTPDSAIDGPCPAFYPQFAAGSA